MSGEDNNNIKNQQKKDAFSQTIRIFRLKGPNQYLFEWKKKSSYLISQY